MNTRPQGTVVRTALAGVLLAAAVGAGGASIAVAQDESAPPEGSAAAEPSLTFGMILVGPQNDHGWSQAHREAGEYLEEQLGATMIVLDKVNTADRPETTVDQVARDMIDQGAQLIFFTSDDMKDGAALAAETYPDVPDDLGLRRQRLGRRARTTTRTWPTSATSWARWSTAR